MKNQPIPEEELPSLPDNLKVKIKSNKRDKAPLKKKRGTDFMHGDAYI